MGKKIPDKVTGMEKVAYVMANLGNIPLMVLLSSFLLIFYTDVIGLNAAAVATLFLISKVVDGLSDPIMGFVLDHMPKGKLGQFRTTLLWGSIICGINYILLWFGPAWAPAGKLAIVYITYLLLGITFDVMDISLNSLLPVMTDDLKERNTLSALKGAFYMIGIVAISVAAPIIVADGTLGSYYKLIFGAVIFVIVFSVIGALGIRERISKPEDPDAQYGIKDLFKILSHRPVFTYFIANFVAMTGMMLGNGAGTFFYTYVLGDLTIMAGVSMLMFVGLLPMAVLSGYFTNKLGKKNFWIIGTIITILAAVIRLIDVRSIPILMISSVIGGIASGATMPLGYGIQADNTNYVEHVSGKRVEAAVASLSSFISKCAQGLGGAIPGYLLAATGYVAGASNQPSSVTNGIISCVIIIPIIFSVIAITVMKWGYNLDKEKVEEINKDLMVKHNNAA